MNSKNSDAEIKAEEISNRIHFIKPKLIVGIGASAGGLAPLKKLVSELPTSLDITYIILQHLSPDFKSVTHEILAQKTILKVKQAEDCEQLQANTIYILPSRKNLILADDKILLAEVDNARLSHPIDAFFKSLASERMKSAIGIILSGTGTDGTLGVRHLKEAGAFVIVQDPKTADFASMPQSAIDIGVDCIMRVDLIGQKIADYLKHLNQDDLKIADENNLPVTNEVFKLLKERSQIDFGEYKINTIERRISHRMGVLGVTDFDDYMTFLKREVKEIDALTQDLLINVTEFFRDLVTWNVLSKSVLKPILLKKAENNPLRVWSVGCSTGEEAYTLAIAIFETLEKLGIKRDFQIFASDVDIQAIRSASLGTFSVSICETIPEKIKHKYFHFLNGCYHVNNSVRDKIVFAHHNILNDPPFSNIDLVVCRNMLIYFLPTAQKKALSNIHFSLESNGLLFLGLAESHSPLKSYFEVLDANHKFYQKIPNKRIPLSNLILSREQSTLKKSTASLAANRHTKRLDPVGIAPISRIKESLFDIFVPPTIILDQQDNIIFSFGDTSTYTRKISAGVFTTHYRSIINKSLIPVIESVIKQVAETNKRLILTDVEIKKDNICLSIDAQRIYKVGDLSEGYLALSFSQPIRLNTLQKTTQSHNDESQADLRIVQLDADLVDARLIIGEKELDIEQMTEELQTSNEELMTSNEELQSTNEELHSVNEELYTVNAELQEKIQLLERANDDLDSILELTEIGVIYLDRHLLIRRFTSNAKKYVNLLPIDIDRPFSDIACQYNEQNMPAWLDQVIATGRSIIKTVILSDKNNTAVKVSINPSFGQEQKINGVIIVFEDAN